MFDAISGATQAAAKVSAQGGDLTTAVAVQKKAQESQTAAMQKLITDFTGVGQMVNKVA